MTGAELLRLALYAVMTAALGTLALRACRADREAGNPAAAFLAGQLVWLTLFLVHAWLRLPATHTVPTAGVLAVAASSVAWRRNGSADVRRIAGAAVCLTIVLVLFFPQALLQTARGPLTGWDARSIWFFHGKAIWVGEGIRAAHFADPTMALFHTDYPLLIPVQAAVLGMLNGVWSESAVKSFLILNLAAYLALLAGVLRRRGWPLLAAWGAAALAGSVAPEGYVSGYADNHYAMPLAVAALALSAPRAPRGHDGAKGAVATALLLAIFALNVKHEATWYALLILSGATLLKRARPSLPTLRLIALGAVPCLLWSLFTRLHGIENDLGLARHLAAPLPALRQIAGRWPSIRQALGAVHGGMGTLPVAGLWLMVAATAASAGRRKGCAGPLVSTPELALWGLFFLVHSLLAVTYGLTPHDVNWHLDTSLDRLLVFPCLLLVMLVFTAVERALAFHEFHVESDREDRR